MNKADRIVYSIHKKENKVINGLVKDINKLMKENEKLQKSGILNNSSYNNLVQENLTFNIEQLFIALCQFIGYAIDYDIESHWKYENNEYSKDLLEELMLYWIPYRTKVMKQIKMGEW